MGHDTGAENDLEVGVAWRSRTWNNVSDVPHPRNELHQSLEPETKARMWNRSILPQLGLSLIHI